MPFQEKCIKNFNFFYLVQNNCKPIYIEILLAYVVVSIRIQLHTYFCFYKIDYTDSIDRDSSFKGEGGRKKALISGPM